METPIVYRHVRVAYRTTEEGRTIAEIRPRHLLAKVLQVLTETDTTLAEFWTSTMLFGWALFFFDPWPAGSGTIYFHMAQVLPELVWGILCGALAIVMSYGNVTRTLRFRRVGAFLSSVLFLFVTMIGMAADIHALYVPTYATNSLVMAVVYLRLSVGENRGRA
jgi:hypothetical protein